MFGADDTHQPYFTPAILPVTFDLSLIVVDTKQPLGTVTVRERVCEAGGGSQGLWSEPQG